MWRLTLTTRLTLIVVMLSTLITTFVAMALSYIVFIQTENQIRNLLIEKTTHIVEDYLVLDGGQIKPKERPEGESLAAELRSFDLSLFIADEELKPLALYGIYRNLDSQQTQLFMNTAVSDRLRNQPAGLYVDIETKTFGAYDTYTIPLMHQSTLVGFAQVAKPNDVLPLLKNSLKIGLMILLPLSWLVSLVAAGLSTRMALSPFQKLVSYLERVNVNNPTQLINVPVSIDYETGILTRSFNVLMERVRKTLQRQRLLAQNISHEFKTPLTQIATSMQVLADSLPASAKSQVENIEKEVVDLGKNVDALLDISLGELDNTIDQKPWKVRNLIEDIIASYQTTPVVQIDMPYTFRLNFPVSHARILFNNLLQNALKYTPSSGFIKISGSSKSNYWKIEIENTVHTSISRLDKVFHRHYRDNFSIDRRGHGIGLAIVKEICSTHTIAIEMENTSNKSVHVKLSGKHIV